MHVRDKIRTRDLLVRSQTLYPAELHVHFTGDFSTASMIIVSWIAFVNQIFKNIFANIFASFSKFQHGRQGRKGTVLCLLRGGDKEPSPVSLPAAPSFLGMT